MRVLAAFSVLCLPVGLVTVALVNPLRAGTVNFSNRSVSASACGSLLPSPVCDSPTDQVNDQLGGFQGDLTANNSTGGTAEATAEQDSDLAVGAYVGNLAVSAFANAGGATGFQISDGDALGQYSVTFTLSQTTSFDISATGAVAEGASFSSAYAQLVLTATPMGAQAFSLQATSTGSFDESASVTLSPGTYLLFVEVSAAAQSQGAGAVSASADIEFSVTTPSPDPTFRRGDANSDGVFDISDPTYLLEALFVIGSPQPVCNSACDINDDGVVDVTDPVYALEALFILGSPPPPAPVACGLDPTPDTLDCTDGAPCP